MNNYKATGRLTKDPELRALPDGTAVCKITIAVKGLARGDEEVGYIDVTSFGAGGEAAARVLSKGWLVLADGRLQYHDWETQEGAKRRSWELIGNVEFLAAPRSESSEASEPETAPAAA
jgi:single-strand DNA-binding protein